MPAGREEARESWLAGLRLCLLHLDTGSPSSWRRADSSARAPRCARCVGRCPSTWATCASTRRSTRRRCWASCGAALRCEARARVAEVWEARPEERPTCPTRHSAQCALESRPRRALCASCVVRQRVVQSWQSWPQQLVLLPQTPRIFSLSALLARLRWSVAGRRNCRDGLVEPVRRQPDQACPARPVARRAYQGGRAQHPQQQRLCSSRAGHTTA